MAAMLPVCLSKEEQDILLLEVIPVVPLLFQKQPHHMELSATVPMESPQKRQKKKKKRKPQREEGEIDTATALINSPQLPEAPAPVDLDTPQKKRRETREVGETGAALTPDIHPELPEGPEPVDLDTPQKKKKRKTRDPGDTGAATVFIHSPQLPEAPVPVDLDTPGEKEEEKKKKRRKRKRGREEEERETSPVLPHTASDPDPQLRRKRGREEEERETSPVLPHTASDPDPQLKRKRGREEEERETSPVLPHTASDADPQLKRKRGREEEERETSPVLPHTASDPDPQLKRKRKRGREEAGGEGGSLPVETERGGGGGGGGGGAVKEKKKRKKEKLRTEEREEGGGVSLGETGGGEEQGKMDGETRERETDGQTAVAVETRKTKKKHKSMVTVTTDHNTPHTTAGEEERRRGEDKRRGEVLEPAATQAAIQDGVTVTEGKKKRRRTILKENGKKKRSKRKSRRTGTVDGGMQQDRRALENLRELQEFFPDDLSSRSRYRDDNIAKMLRYDLPRFKEFRRQGIELRSGRFSAQENQRIRENVMDFLSLTGISSALHLFDPKRYMQAQQEADIRKLRAQHRFQERIADGVARPCYMVYNRAKRMIDEFNHKGSFSEDELHNLKKLQTFHGNNWKIISQKMDRSIFSLEKRFNHIGSNHGPWESEEVGRLMKALQAHMESQLPVGHEGSGAGGLWLYRQQLIVNLPWMEVSHQVQTRTWTQCRVKWFSILKTKMAAGRHSVLRGRPQTVQTKIDLINKLYTMNVEDHVDIDWEEVALAVGRVSPFDVQQAFHRLKVSRVPMWSSCPYCDIIDFLRKNEVPRLEEVLKKMRSVGQQEEEEETRGEERQEREEKYLLSEIFSQEEDFREVDNT